VSEANVTIRIVDVTGLLCTQNKRHTKLHWWCHPRHMSRRIKRLVRTHPDGIEAGMLDYALWCLLVSEITEQEPRDALVDSCGADIPISDLADEWRVGLPLVDGFLRRCEQPEVGLLTGVTSTVDEPSTGRLPVVEPKESKGKEIRGEERRVAPAPQRRVVPIEAVQVAEYLQAAILEAASDHRCAKDGTTEKWARDIDLAMRIDGRSAKELMGAIDYAHRSDEGSFWKPNVQSGAKLRAKFDTMKAQAARDGNGKVTQDQFMEEIRRRM